MSSSPQQQQQQQFQPPPGQSGVVGQTKVVQHTGRCIEQGLTYIKKGQEQPLVCAGGCVESDRRRQQQQRQQAAHQQQVAQAAPQQQRQAAPQPQQQQQGGFGSFQAEKVVMHGPWTSTDGIKHSGVCNGQTSPNKAGKTFQCRGACMLVTTKYAGASSQDIASVLAGVGRATITAAHITAAGAEQAARITADSVFAQAHATFESGRMIASSHLQSAVITAESAERIAKENRESVERIAKADRESAERIAAGQDLAERRRVGGGASGAAQ